MKKGDPIRFDHIAPKKGTILAAIPANVNRSDYIFDILNSDIEYEMRLGGIARYPEVSYLVASKPACSRCRTRLYHVPESQVLYDIESSNPQTKE